MAEHFHAMAGLHGYLPNMSEVCESYESAVETIATVHELGKNRTSQLRRDGYIELNLRRDGNEYAEITPCSEDDCNSEMDY